MPSVCRPYAVRREPPKIPAVARRTNPPLPAPAGGNAELLSPQASGIFPRMTYIITEPCMSEKDASCVDVCPVDCIYEGEDQYYIHPEECIDCGACVPECPVEAIYPDDEVPEQYDAFTAKNYTYFDVPPPD